MPAGKNKKILDRKTSVFILINGIVISILSLILFGIGITKSKELACTMAFSVLSLSQIVFAISMRSDRSFFSLKAHRFSPSFIIILMVSLLLIIAVLTIPVFMKIFGFVVMDTNTWIMIVLLSFIPLLSSEIVKIFNRKSAK